MFGSKSLFLSLLAITSLVVPRIVQDGSLDPLKIVGSRVLFAQKKRRYHVLSSTLSAV
jgi:hypothetical protein